VEDVYVPHFNVMADEAVAGFLDGIGAAELTTIGPDGYPESTLMPFVRDGERLLMHLARANPHWKSIEPGTPALAMVSGAQAYVSPAWYASKQEHGRVVPTWNYSKVHLYGRAFVRDDPVWLLDLVTRLTDLNESGRLAPWSVSDAPADYVRKQLGAIVGLELVVERVEAKAKLSQNRSDADRAGVVTGLSQSGRPRDHAVAQDMRRLEGLTTWTRSRVARPVRDLAVARAFYEGALGLPVDGGFADHEGYDGVFLTLPGGAQLELTTGGPAPQPGTDDDLLVLYLATEDEVSRASEELARNATRVPSGNPYWDRCGATFVDPDGYRVVIAKAP
jgi:transcriptional regulator